MSDTGPAYEIIGDRVPAVFQGPISNDLHVCHYINGEPNHCHKKEIPENQWLNLKVIQARDRKVKQELHSGAISNTDRGIW